MDLGVGRPDGMGKILDRIHGLLLAHAVNDHDGLLGKARGYFFAHHHPIGRPVRMQRTTAINLRRCQSAAQVALAVDGAASAFEFGKPRRRSECGHPAKIELFQAGQLQQAVRQVRDRIAPEVDLTKLDQRADGVGQVVSRLFRKCSSRSRTSREIDAGRPVRRLSVTRNSSRPDIAGHGLGQGLEGVRADVQIAQAAQAAERRRKRLRAHCHAGRENR